MSIIPSGTERPVVIGHRGVRAKMPENTIISFQLAVEEGALGVETDLQITKDGHMMCFHDSSLGRVTNSEGDLADYTLEELRGVKVIHDSIPPQPIPTFEEFLNWLPENIGLVLELKDEKFNEPEWAKKLSIMLKHHNVVNRIAIVSFNKESISTAKQVIPEIPTGFITYANLSPNQPVEFLGPLFPVLWFNPFYVRQAHKLGKLVAPLDPWPDGRMKSYLRWGIDAVLSDDPGKTIRAIAEIRKKMQ